MLLLYDSFNVIILRDEILEANCQTTLDQKIRKRSKTDEKGSKNLVRVSQLLTSQYEFLFLDHKV